jgi:hypothetical protein
VNVAHGGIGGGGIGSAIAVAFLTLLLPGAGKEALDPDRRAFEPGYSLSVSVAPVHAEDPVNARGQLGEVQNRIEAYRHVLTLVVAVLAEIQRSIPGNVAFRWAVVERVAGGLGSGYIGESTSVEWL